MTSPNLQLTRAYGNEDVYRDKLAGRPPFLEAMAVKVSSPRELHGSFEDNLVSHEAMARLASIGTDIGKDLAKEAGIGDFASGIGKLLGGAKSAIQGAAKPGGLLQQAKSMKWKLPAAAAVAGTGYLGYKAVKGGLNYMSEEGRPANWGVGPRVPFGVNQYGYPQLGTPL